MEIYFVLSGNSVVNKAAANIKAIIPASILTGTWSTEYS
jgi:hypothetical protein